MPADDRKRIYDALVIPNDALDKGGIEILRAGLIADELYVTARRTYDDPGRWGEVLGEVARRIARLYAAEGRFTHKDAVVAIEGAFAADLGAPVIGKKRKPARSAKRVKPRAKARAKTKR